MDKDKNIMPHLELFPRLAKVGRFLNRVVLGPHLFSPVSDHEFKHPLDDTFERPAYTEPNDGEAGYGAWLDGEK